MPEVSPIEHELVKATRFKGDKWPKRQDYLAALLQAIDKLSNDAYDLLTDEAVDWHKAAVKAHDSKAVIPDFEGIDEESADEAPSGEDNHGGEAAEPDNAEDANAGGPAQAGSAPKKTKIKPEDYAKITGEKDRYGVYIGTKTHEALKLYEKGTSMKDIESALNGKFRNILRKMGDEGHKVERLGAGIWKLTHKDDVK